MYITRMVIGSLPEQLAEFAETPAKPFPPFTEPVEFNFDEQVNLFAGPNASGKTGVLANLFDCIASGVDEIPATCSWGLIGFIDPTSELVPNTYDFSHPNGPVLMEPYRALLYVLNKMTVVAIPAARIGYNPSQSGNTVIKNDFLRVVAGDILQPICAASIQNLVAEMRDEIESDWESLNEQLNDEYIGYIFEAKNQLHEVYGGHILGESAPTIRNSYESAEMLQQALNVSYACAREICREIIAGDALHNATIVSEGVTDAGLPSASAKLEMGARIKTSDPVQNDADASPLPIAQLSSGTQGTLWWIRLLALCLLKASYYRSGWEKQPAVLLIDEIENHLHPTWQRRVIPALLKHFPGLQIFATTHSPFVIAGLKAGQVHLLNRDAKGVITASSNTEDIVGWTADEILRVFMGVEDPTDDATAAAARELRQLRDTGPHPDEREEEQRQARMRELQQQVDRSLLAGGPRAAEEERFAENLNRILEKYRLTKDLNQENG